MLIDPFGRSIDYIRLSVTDRCDLRCFYCLPKGFKDFEEPEHWLTFDVRNLEPGSEPGSQNLEPGSGFVY